jgi:hypothetical protein
LLSKKIRLQAVERETSMSLIFNRTSSPAYLHLPAQRPVYKVIGAFAAGILVATLLLYRPSDTAKFTQRGNAAALAVAPVSDTDGSAGKAGLPDDGSAGNDEADAIARKANQKRRAGSSTRGPNTVERVVTLSDGRRITIYQDASSGSARRYGNDGQPDRLPLGPFRLNAPNFPR